MSIASTSAHLPVVRSALERLCELMGFDETTRGDVVLSVDEALTNVIKHAYHGANDRPIEVTFRPLKIEGGVAVRIEVRDWGDVVEPQEIKSRELSDVRPGGLGVHIMHSCMDEVSFAPAPGGGTILAMVKEYVRRTGSG